MNRWLTDTALRPYLLHTASRPASASSRWRVTLSWQSTVRIAATQSCWKSFSAYREKSTLPTACPTSHQHRRRCLVGSSTRSRLRRAKRPRPMQTRLARQTSRTLLSQPHSSLSGITPKARLQTRQRRQPHSGSRRPSKAKSASSGRSSATKEMHSS